MTEEKSWRVLWDSIDAAREELWESEAEAQKNFFKSLRIAIEKYAREVDPDSFDECGQPIETMGAEV